jgi:hypothetical protein
MDISEAVGRENTRWGTIGNFNSRIDVIKNFLSARISWITNSLGPFTTCENVVTPPLVISKIMYQPPVNASFPSSSDQEFIEITNNSNNSIDMTGLYFSGTGFSYQFPIGYICPPQGVLYLANNLETFELRYNTSPFGEFARNLNNEGQQIVIADAFGNVIDEVHYSNQIPWPESSGNGKYLKLTDLNSDNNIGSNWTGTNEDLSKDVITGIEQAVELDVYPNPIQNRLELKSGQEIKIVRLYNMRGELVENKFCNCYSTSMDFRKYPAGLYSIAIQTKTNLIIKKLIKSSE